MTPVSPFRLRLVAFIVAAGLLGGLAWWFTGTSAPKEHAPNIAEHHAAPQAVGAVAEPALPITPPAAEPPPEAEPDHPSHAAPGGGTPAYRLFGSDWGHEPKPELAAFDEWANRYLAAAQADKAKLLPEGLALVAGRMSLLKELIKTDPRQVIASTVPIAVRTQLPPEVLGQLEQRVAGVGRVSLLGSLAEPGGTVAQSLFRSTLVNGQEYQTYVYGRRMDQTTKTEGYHYD